MMMMMMMMFDHDETLTFSKFWAELTRIHFINIRFFGTSFDLHFFLLPDMFISESIVWFVKRLFRLISSCPI